MRKKVLKWTAIAALSVPTLLLTLAALLYLPPVQNWAVDKVAAIASEKLDMEVTVGTVRLEWPLDLGINDFRAIHKGDTLADIGHLKVDVQLRPLFSKQVVVNQLSVDRAKLNTNGFISDLRVKGYVGELWLRSDGIDLDKETAVVNGARLSNANIDIALSDTAAVDTTTSVVRWRIDADSLSISRTAMTIHTAGDTLNIEAYMGHAVAREAAVDLGTGTYSIGSLDWRDGCLSYDDTTQPLTDALDYNHIALTDIRLGIDSIYYGPKGTSLYIRQTALKHAASGLQITQIAGGVRLDTTFTHVEMPHIILRTPDSDIEAEVSVANKIKMRLNAQIGKQDLTRLAGSLPQQVVRQYPNHPLTIRGSVNGNMERMEITGLDMTLPTALHLKADGVVYNVANPKQMRGQLDVKAETENLDFIRPLLPSADYRLPRMTMAATLKADGRRYDADIALHEAGGTVKARVSTTKPADIASYDADIKIDHLNLYHFLPGNTLYENTADMTAELALRNGRAVGTIAGQNSLFDGSIGFDAQLSTKRVEATISPRLECIDLYALKLSDKPLTIGMGGSVDVKSDMNMNHELKGRLSNLSIASKKGTYLPEDLGLLLRTNRDTTLARIQSGDFIVKMDASGGYERLLKQGTTLMDSLTAQYKNKEIDQAEAIRLLPTLKLHVESKRNNPVANLLRTKEIDFKELLLDLNTSPATGINGQMHLYSFVYDSTRIDTVKIALTQKGERMTYQAQVCNNRKNPQFVFNTLIDGHIHEHGAVAGVRYYDGQGRMGIRLGATASMVDEGVSIKLMPDRPTIGYKEFNLNKDNFLLIGKNNRLQAKVDLIADDNTGLKIYTEDPENQESLGNPDTYLQDLTVSVYQFDLGELTSVIPYLPRITGKLNGDYHIVMDQREKISVVSDMAVQQMTYEGSPIGNISTELVYMQREDDAHAIEARLMLDEEEFGLLQGSMAPSTTPNGEGSIDAKFTMTRLPLSIINGFVTDQIIGLDGYGEGDVTINGKVSAPQVNGEVYLDSAYLISQPYGVRMRFDNDPVRIVGSHLLLENFGLYAYNNEPLNIMGDIDFSNPANISMEMRMRAQNLQLINAKQTPKSLAFGKAFVNFYARMNGPLDGLRIRGRLDVLGSTDMSYMLLDSPLSTDNRLEELVKFTDFNDTTQTVAAGRPKPSGIDMDLTVSVSQGSHIVCNLNQEQTNYIDLMGGGDLRMRYGGAEGLTLTGRYTLSNGEMKYSMPVIPLKTFTIKNGSYVEFFGDPMNPRLNITATEYKKATVGQEDGISRSVAFECGVIITKTLSDMGLQFIISAPEDLTINSELQSMSPEERGKLAVTMLTTGMYLADGNTSGFSMNSVLSAYLQSEINNITGSALKTLDLSVGLDNTTDATGHTHTDYSFKFSKRLFDNRLKIQLGGKVSSGASEMPGQRQSFFDNVTMEYRLDQSGTKNVKLFYQQNVYDWLDGYTGLYGVGYVWRKKMDSLLDVFKMFSKESQQQPTMMRTRPAAPRDSLTKDSLRHEIH